MTPSPTIKLTAAQILLLIAAFLAPITGGFVMSDQTKVDPGALLTALSEGQAPVLQHAIIALPVFLAMMVLLLARRIQQIPHIYVGAALMGFVALLAPSVMVSNYRAVSVNVWIEWATYAVAFFAAVCGLGRRLGPRALLLAIFAGSVWIALKGILEYGAVRSFDPTWRIFAGWANPNATAAMLLLGAFCALATFWVEERLAKLGVALGGAFILFALYLTGSKGAVAIALPVGLVAFALIIGKRGVVPFVIGAVIVAVAGLGFLKSLPPVGTLLAMAFAAYSAGQSRGQLIATFAVGLGLIGLLTVTAPASPKGATPGSRIGAASSTQEQSATFRLNLWKSAAALAKEKPATGWGLGSYRYESARPGLATQTVFAHNSFLQLAAEAGAVPVLAFLTFLGLWTRRALRGSSRLPDKQRLPFAAAFGGAVAFLVHSLVDSDFSYFGLGLSFFLVLAAATVLAADAVAPEFIPKNSRWVAAVSVSSFILLFGYFAWGDLAKSQVRFAQSSGQPGDLAALDGFAGWDGEAAFLKSRALTGPDAVAALEGAYQLQPTLKIGRALAAAKAREGNFLSAEVTLITALAHDPNSLRTLYALMETQRGGGMMDKAVETARRLVAVEDSSYFKIRSLDELVPTETYLARLVIADQAKSSKEKADLIAGCVAGLDEYLRLTVPQVKKAAQLGANADFAGETMQNVQEKLGIGANAARAGAKLYRQLGNAAEAVKLEEAATKFEAAIAPS